MYQSSCSERVSRRQRRRSKKHPSIWKSWLSWVGLAALIPMIAIPLFEECCMVGVIAILGLDVSDSGVHNAATVEKICRAETQALRAGDRAIDIAYADTTEPTYSSEVETVTQMFPRCQSYAKQQRPATVGKGQGTSPMLLLDRIQTQVQIQRQAGHQQPIAAVVWLQAAEPGPGLPPLDFAALGQRIKQITDDRGRVAIIGPTGKLRENLDKLSAQNPSLRVCNVADYQSCIRSTFKDARTLPSGK